MSKFATMSDVDLVVKARQSTHDAETMAEKREALVEIVSRCSKIVGGVVRQTLAPLTGRIDVTVESKDVTEEVLLAVLDRLAHFDETRNEPLLAWAVAIARNKSADVYRALTKSPTDDICDWIEQLRSEASSPSRPFRREEMAALVQERLALLRPIDRQALTLCDLQGLSLKEAAEQVGVSIPAMCLRRQRARDAMRALFPGTVSDYLSNG
jgi:RNA polymerase sigma-70 factor (ECF subfamily)